MDRLLHGPAQVKARQEADPVTLMINKRGEQITATVTSHNNIASPGLTINS